MEHLIHAEYVPSVWSLCYGTYVKYYVFTVLMFPHMYFLFFMNTLIRFFRFSCVCACGLLLFLVKTTMAQSANPSSQRRTQAEKDSIYRLTPVSVVALRQPERIIETPLAISVINKAQFEQSRRFGLDEALSLVPGVLVQSRSGNADVRVMVRGFGARGAGERSNAGTSRGLRFYVNGVPETEPDGRTSFDLLDLTAAQSIEVLRSNASALWGNAAGGVVNISTIPQFAQGQRGYASAGLMVGDFGFRKQSVQAGVQIDGGVVYGTFSNTDFDGWRQASASTLDQAQMGFILNPSERLKVNIFLNAAQNRFGIPGALTQAQFDADPTRAQDDPTVYAPTYLARRERRDNRLGRIGTTMEYTLNDDHAITAMAYAQTKYLQRSERNTYRDFNRYHLGGNLLYRGTLYRNNDLTIRFLGGMDNQYQDGAILFYNLVNGERGTTLRTNKAEGAGNFGVFAQAEIMLGEKFSAVVSGRFDRITYFSQDYILPRLNATRSFEQVTPKLGLSYRLNENTTLYANLGGGVEVPAGNEVDPPATFGEDTLTSLNPLLDPIRSRTYEIGIKHIAQFEDLPIKALALDAAGYLINITNDIVPYRGGRFYFTAGASRRVGGELGATASFRGGLTLMLMATLGNNTFVDYRVDSVHYNLRSAGRFADFTGRQQPGIPSFFGSARVRWVPEFFPYINTEIEYRTVGSYYADDANTINVASYNVMDATIGGDIPVAENFVLRAFIRMNNVADTKFIGSIWINPDRSATGQSAFIEPGLPRMLTASISAQYRW